MSLRAIHILFIITADLLSVGFGVWSYIEKKPIFWTVSAFAVMIVLDLYLFWFIKKKAPVA